MPALRVGVVGCGRMGKERARCAYAAAAKLAAVFDVDQERSRELADLYGAKSVGTVEEFFETELDAVFLCVAPGIRGDVEMQSISAGLPLYVEKPVGISAASCDRVLAQLRRKRVINGVGYMNRYRASIQLAKKVLESATVIGFSAHWVCKRYGVPWWEVEQASGGPHNEQATHLYDLCRFVVGEILRMKSIFSGTSRVASALECQSDIPGTIFYSCDGNEKAIGMQIYTDRGTLSLAGWNFGLTSNSIDGRISDEALEDIFLIETTAFLDAVRLGRQDLIRSSFDDAMETQAVMDAVRRSGQEERAISVARRDGNLAYGD